MLMLLRHESASILLLRAGSMLRVRSAGTIMCLASAAAFGAMAVFGKLAYEEGVNVGTLLAARFVFASLLFWLVLRPRELRAMTRRDVLIALALGAVGYAAQAGFFFSALERIDAGLLALILYTFPAMVTVAAIVIGRERADARRFAALVLASAGLALVVAGAGAGKLDPLGVGFALAAAVVYTTYILVGDGVAGRVPARVLSTLVCTGAAITLVSGSAALGELRPGDVSLEGWGWLASLAVVSTVASIGLFFAGLKRVGPTTASILSTLEPVVTVVLAFIVFGETLGVVQLLGGALVIGAVLVLQIRKLPLRTPGRIRAAARPSA
jgi:drug/metabolite transporter (DMT)-like permease